jgi:hypothetical protein
MNMLDYVGRAAVKQRPFKRVILPVLGNQRRVGIGNTDALHIVVLGSVLQESFDLAVFEADDGHREPVGLVLGTEEFGAGKQGRQKGK